MLKITILLAAAWMGAEGRPADEEILAGAEARIREHRMREVTLRILDDAGRPVPEGARIEVEQTRHEFLFGCNIFALGRLRTEEENKIYEDRFAEVFNFATLPFYWWNYERSRGEPDYADTERILKFCRERNITAKGHPLAWNYTDPRWLPENPREAMDLQIRRIGDCARRFRGEIMIWDVVNEAAHYDRDHVRSQAPKLTRAIDEMGVGAYVRGAFRSAREASPEAVLVINDYRLDAQYETRVLKELAGEDGRPLYDAIGLQSHQHGGAKRLAELWQVCERFAKYGKPLHWTENTFVSAEEGWDLAKKRPGQRWASTPEGELRQAEDTVRFYTALFSHPAVEAITWWDFCDQRAWQSAPAGFLRADLTAKPSYEKLRRLIKDAWWTKTALTAGEGGAVRLRGFFGDYRVRTGEGAAAREGTFAIRRHAPKDVIEVRLRAPGEAAAARP